MTTKLARRRWLKSRAQLPGTQQGGFTMVEIMITMLLLTVVLIGLAALQIATIRQVSLSRRASGALRLGQLVLEEYRGTPFINLPQIDSPDWELEYKKDNVTHMEGVGEDGEMAGPYTVHRLVEKPTGAGVASTGDILITIRVSWLDIMPGTNPDPTLRYRTLDVLLTMKRADYQ